MRKLYLVAIMLHLFIFALGEGTPTEKKPDTMLFGDVTCCGDHIPFATISVKGTNIATIADLTGHYSLIGAPVGEQTIVFSAVGYKSAEYTVTLVDGEEITLMAEMEPDMIGLEQVVVSADRSEKSRKDAPTIISSISPKLMERSQSVTLSEGLNFTPGVRLENNCQNCGFTQVRMNGLEGPYSQILINSRPVFSGLAGVYGLELIPSNMIDRIEVVRGGGSALFGGNAIAGTINLITKEPVTDSYTVNSSISAIGEDGTTDYNLNINGSVVSSDYRSGLSIYGFKRKRDAYDANDDGFSEMSKINNSTFGASFFQNVGARSKITLDYFYIDESRRGGNDFEKPNHEADISEAIDHEINSMSLSFDKLYNDHDKFSIYGAFQSVDRDTYYGAEQDLSAYGKTKDFSYNIGTQLHKDVEKFLFLPSELVVGAEMTSSALEDKKLGYLDLETLEHKENTQVADQAVSTYGFFAQNEWVADKFRLSIGFRTEHYNIEDKQGESDKIDGNVFSPRASFLFDITDELQFRASYAKGYRAPQIFDEDLHIETSGARKVIHENDPDLTQETSQSYTGSLDFTKALGNWQIQLLAEGFYTSLDNPFVNEYGEPDEDGTVTYTRINAEEGAIVQGINFEFNASKGSDFIWQSGYTLQSSKYESEQEFGEKKFFRTPDSYGYFTLTYSPGTLFNFSLNGNYTGKMLVPYFGNTIVDPEAGQLNESDPFFDLGAKLSHNFKLDDELSLQLYGGIKNIFNSYQDDFDSGVDRDPGYVYGPLAPRTFYIGLKFGNIL